MKRFFLILGIFIGIMAVPVLRFFIRGGAFAVIKPHNPYNTMAVPGMPGAEDIAIDHEAGIAFVSSCDRRVTEGEAAPDGAIFLLDLRAALPAPVKLTSDLGFSFRPHGISFFADSVGAEKWLFVVNHRNEADGIVHSIERFEYLGGALIHRESIFSDFLVSPNDIHGVSPEAFYVTNDHGEKSLKLVGVSLEDFLFLEESYVVYYDGKSFAQTGRKMSYANGINGTRDGKYIFVAALGQREIQVYARNRSGILEFLFPIKIDSMVDNISLDWEGNLWTAGHPNAFQFLAHSSDANVLAPTQVFKVTFEPSVSNPFEQWRVDELLLDAGGLISGASVAAPWEGLFLIGSVFDGSVVICSLPPGL